MHVEVQFHEPQRLYLHFSMSHGVRCSSGSLTDQKSRSPVLDNTAMPDWGCQNTCQAQLPSRRQPDKHLAKMRKMTDQSCIPENEAAAWGCGGRAQPEPEPYQKITRKIPDKSTSDKRPTRPQQPSKKSRKEPRDHLTSYLADLEKEFHPTPAQKGLHGCILKKASCASSRIILDLFSGSGRLGAAWCLFVSGILAWVWKT